MAHAVEVQKVEDLPDIPIEGLDYPEQRRFVVFYTLLSQNVNKSVHYLLFGWLSKHNIVAVTAQRFNLLVLSVVADADYRNEGLLYHLDHRCRPSSIASAQPVHLVQNHKDFLLLF